MTRRIRLRRACLGVAPAIVVLAAMPLVFAGDTEPKGLAGSYMTAAINGFLNGQGQPPTQTHPPASAVAWANDAARKWRDGGKGATPVCYRNLRSAAGRDVGGEYNWKTKKEPARILINLDYFINTAITLKAMTQSQVMTPQGPGLLMSHQGLAGYFMMTVHEEFMHSCQKWPIHDHLAGQDWHCIHHAGAPINGDPHGAGSTYDNDTGTPKSEKPKEAYDLAQHALDAEQAANEFEASYAQLCDFLTFCGEPTVENKKDWLQKLKDICKELDAYCKAFDAAYGAFNAAYDAFALKYPKDESATPPTDCIKSYTADYTGMHKKGPNRGTANGSAPVTITFKFEAYKKALDKQNDAKNDKTDKPPVPPGSPPGTQPGPSKLEKKKSDLKALCP